jgi:hypothetical protein
MCLSPLGSGSAGWLRSKIVEAVTVFLGFVLSALSLCVPLHSLSSHIRSLAVPARTNSPLLCLPSFFLRTLMW